MQCSVKYLMTFYFIVQAPHVPELGEEYAEIHGLYKHLCFYYKFNLIGYT